MRAKIRENQGDSPRRLFVAAALLLVCLLSTCSKNVTRVDPCAMYGAWSGSLDMTFPDSTKRYLMEIQITRLGNGDVCLSCTCPGTDGVRLNGLSPADGASTGWAEAETVADPRVQFRVTAFIHGSAAAFAGARDGPTLKGTCTVSSLSASGAWTLQKMQ
jgi:hypothetical protein